MVDNPLCVARARHCCKQRSCKKRQGITGLLLEPHKVGAGRKDQPKEMLELSEAVLESITVVDLNLILRKGLLWLHSDEIKQLPRLS